MFIIFLLFLSIQGIYGKNCDDECHLKVALELENLKDSFTIPSNLIDVVSKYKFIKNLTQNVEDVTSQLKLLDEVLKGSLDVLNREKDKYNEKINNCIEVKGIYKNVTTIMGTIAGKIKSFNDSYENMADRIRDSKERSLQQRNDLESLVLPDYAINNYFCNTSLADTVRKSITIGKEIIIILNHVKDNLFENLKEHNAEFKKLLDDIDNLDTNIEEPLKINEETEKLLAKISEEIENLQKMLSKINKNNTTSNKLDTTKSVAKMDEQLKEFEKILQLLFSEENIKRVKHKIRNARKLIDIIKEKTELKKEFDDIRNIVTHLQTQGVCKLVDVNFEP